jgi:inosose dehydratase
MQRITRRAALALPLVAGVAPLRADPPAPIPLGFSLYGMKTLKLPDALRTCRDVGYDGVEFALMPGYHAEPKALPADARKDVRKRLADLGLAVHGLMELLPELSADAGRQTHLERLKAAADLGHALAPDAPPPIETVLGGKPADWDAVKNKLADSLGKWAEVGKDAKTVIAVKPHVANALHTPDGAAWLVKQVDSPWLRLAFDYSHFALRGAKLTDAVTLLPLTSFIHLKDAKGDASKFEFLLPGEGGTDYAAYAKLVAASKYRGPVVVEVSGQVSAKPGYDAAVAARTSYAALRDSFGLPKSK